MTDMTVNDGRIVNGMLEKLEICSLRNRGHYPVTCEDNVYKEDESIKDRVKGDNPSEGDGTEEENPSTKPDPEEKPTTPTPDEPKPGEIDITKPENEPSTIIEATENGGKVVMSAGEVTKPVNLTKSVTLEGVNAGKAQNFKQEVK